MIHLSELMYMNDFFSLFILVCMLHKYIMFKIKLKLTMKFTSIVKDMFFSASPDNFAHPISANNDKVGR